MGSVRQAILAVWGFGIVLSASADPDAPDAYKSIVNRNAFSIKEEAPVQPPVTNRPPIEAKKEDFYLTGISTIGTPKRPKAYLVAKDTQKKDYDQKFYNLAVGERQGDVTLKEIDEKGRRVRIEYQGEEKWLSMKDNGVPPPVGTAPGSPEVGRNSSMPGQPIPAAPLPVANTAPSASAQPLNYANANNRRTVRGSNNGSAAASATGFGNSGYTPPGAILSTPTPPPPGGNDNGVPILGHPASQTNADLVNQNVAVPPSQAPDFSPNVPAPPVPQY